MPGFGRSLDRILIDDIEEFPMPNDVARSPSRSPQIGDLRCDSGGLLWLVVSIPGMLEGWESEPYCCVAPKNLTSRSHGFGSIDKWVNAVIGTRAWDDPARVALQRFKGGILKRFSTQLIGDWRSSHRDTPAKADDYTIFSRHCPGLLQPRKMWI